MMKRILLLLILTAFLGACASVGPKKVERDRVDYGSALSRSLQEQAVLNIVKSRYSDWPSFLDVSQIVAGYSREGSASLTLDWFPDTSADNVVEPAFSGSFTESPSITFTPLVGADFATTLLEPLDTESILAVAYAGWRADRLFELTLNSVNGKRNAQFVGDSLQPADEDFWRALDLFRDLQRSNAWVLRRSSESSSQSATDGAKDDSKKSDSQKSKKKTKERLELAFRSGNDATTQGKIAELKEILGLSGKAEKLQVVYGDSRGKSGEITFETRTLWEMLWELQRFVVVPADDAAAGIVDRLPAVAEGREPALRIQSGADRPDDAFVAVPYRGRWFWIDNNDRSSKHTLSIVLLMSTLARTGGAAPPQLVIPTR